MESNVADKSVHTTEIRRNSNLSVNVRYYRNQVEIQELDLGLRQCLTLTFLLAYLLCEENDL